MSAWKNTIATDHTEGDPPSNGSAIFVNSGSMENRSSADKKIVAVKSGRMLRVGPAAKAWRGAALD
jgi:hypothetical protein